MCCDVYDHTCTTSKMLTTMVAVGCIYGIGIAKEESRMALTTLMRFSDQGNDFGRVLKILTAITLPGPRFFERSMCHAIRRVPIRESERLKKTALSHLCFELRRRDLSGVSIRMNAESGKME
jgi:hypothetical protein